MKIETPRHRVEGLGSARAGTLDFWHQRLSAVALVPLSVWFVWSALHLVGAEQSLAIAFLGRPLNTVLMILFVGTVVYHMMIGLQVIIEDYVHQPGLKLLAIILNKFFGWGIGMVTVFALLKLAFSA